MSVGRPSSPIIVEGANLFLTPEARDNLFSVGTLILKDSSANKCGVICSSFEIVDSMLLTESEFLEIKEEFVKQVLTKLRFLARREAELLARLHRYHPQVAMHDASIRLSRVMIKTAECPECYEPLYLWAKDGEKVWICGGKVRCGGMMDWLSKLKHLYARKITIDFCQKCSDSEVTKCTKWRRSYTAKCPCICHKLNQDPKEEA